MELFNDSYYAVLSLLTANPWLQKVLSSYTDEKKISAYKFACFFHAVYTSIPNRYDVITTDKSNSLYIGALLHKLLQQDNAYNAMGYHMIKTYTNDEIILQVVKYDYSQAANQLLLTVPLYVQFVSLVDEYYKTYEANSCTPGASINTNKYDSLIQNAFKCSILHMADIGLECIQTYSL